MNEKKSPPHESERAQAQGFGNARGGNAGASGEQGHAHGTHNAAHGCGGGCGECGGCQASPMEILQAELIETRTLAENNLNLAKYKQAELENYMKRQKDAVAVSFSDGKALVALSVLPVLDAFTDAAKIVSDEKSREGIEILGRKLESILTGLGLEEIKCIKGEAFNPHLHNCVASGENSDNSIKEIWQKGYKFAGRVIRPVTVTI